MTTWIWHNNMLQFISGIISTPFKVLTYYMLSTTSKVHVEIEFDIFSSVRNRQFSILYYSLSNIQQKFKCVELLPLSTYYTRNNGLMWCITPRHAACGLVIHSILDAWHNEVISTCVWTWTVLYPLNKMTIHCARFHEIKKSHRPDAHCQMFLTCNATECGRARRMIPVGK
jgi:hypothetical protein